MSVGSASFGFRDLKGKGATDMYLSGRQLELIQVLCGHDSVTTTEKYVKARWRGIVAPKGLTQPQVSKHLRVLREAGIVTSERRGTNIVYALAPDFARRWAAIGANLAGLVAVA